MGVLNRCWHCQISQKDVALICVWGLGLIEEEGEHKAANNYYYCATCCHMYAVHVTTQNSFGCFAIEDGIANKIEFKKKLENLVSRFRKLWSIAPERCRLLQWHLQRLRMMRGEIELRKDQIHDEEIDEVFYSPSSRPYLYNSLISYSQK